NNSDDSLLFVFSAKNNEQLKDVVKGLVEYIKNTNITSLKNIAYTLMDGREWMESRLAIIAKDEKDLLEKLESYLEGSKGDLEVFYGHVEEE
ncbi:KS-MAT linker domain-containing protein, partial [Escherichia sp. TWPC-MK]